MKVLLRNVATRLLSLTAIFGALYIVKDYDLREFLEILQTPLLISLVCLIVSAIISVPIRKTLEEKKALAEKNAASNENEVSNKNEVEREEKTVVKFKIDGLFLVTVIVGILLLSDLITVETYGKIIIVLELLIAMFVLAITLVTIKK